jgi:hypothetical protein
VSGPLRIVSGPEGRAKAEGAPAGDPWIARLVKLVPSEIVAVYLAGRGYAGSIAGFWPVVCLALLVIVRVWGTRGPRRKPQWAAVAISSASFVLWVFAIDGRILGVTLAPDLASLAVLVWTTLIPVLYRGDPAG